MKKYFLTTLIIYLSKLAIALPNSHFKDYEQLDTIIPSYTSNLGNGFSLELKISLALGTHGRGLGFNAITTYTKSGGSISVGVGSTYYLSEIATGKSGLETRIFGGGTANLGKGWSLGYYQTKFISGETSQRIGNVITSYKDWSLTFENDQIGDLGDRYRSHASVLSYKDMSLGINLFTGEPAKDKWARRIIEDDGKYGTYLQARNGDDPDKYRLGVSYFRYKIFRLGADSEYIRHWTQNMLIHDSTKSPQFAMRNKKWRLYSGIYTYNPFSAW